MVKSNWVLFPRSQDSSEDVSQGCDLIWSWGPLSGSLLLAESSSCGCGGEAVREACQNPLHNRTVCFKSPRRAHLQCLLLVEFLPLGTLL